MDVQLTYTDTHIYIFIISYFLNIILKLYYIILCYIILYCIVLYYIIFYYIILYYIISYNVILYYNIISYTHVCTHWIHILYL